MFSIIKLGCGALKPLFPPLTEDFAQIMFGIIIYIAAIGVVFEKFHILIYIKNNYIYRKNPDYKEAVKTYKINKNDIWNIEKKNKIEIKDIKSTNSKVWKEIKEDSIRKKEFLEKELFSNKNETQNSKLNKNQIWEATQENSIHKIKKLRKELSSNHVLLMYQKNKMRSWEIKNIQASNKQIKKEIKNIKLNTKKLKKGLFANKILFRDLSEQQQHYYFQQISLIKKEKDDQLFQNNYYEILKIQSYAKNLKIENKEKLIQTQKSILEKHRLNKGQKIKKGNNGNI